MHHQRQKSLNYFVCTPLGSRVTYKKMFPSSSLYGVSSQVFCFYYLPPVSTTSVVQVAKFVVDTGGAHWVANISANFRKDPNAIFRGLGEDVSWKELEVKILQQCPFNDDNYLTFSVIFIYNSKDVRKIILLSLKVHFK